jgi:hypothetical protein
LPVPLVRQQAKVSLPPSLTAWIRGRLTLETISSELWRILSVKSSL